MLDEFPRARVAVGGGAVRGSRTGPPRPRLRTARLAAALPELGRPRLRRTAGGRPWCGRRGSFPPASSFRMVSTSRPSRLAVSPMVRCLGHTVPRLTFAIMEVNIQGRSLIKREHITMVTASSRRGTLRTLGSRIAWLVEQFAQGSVRGSGGALGNPAANASAPDQGPSPQSQGSRLRADRRGVRNHRSVVADGEGSRTDPARPGRAPHDPLAPSVAEAGGRAGAFRGGPGASSRAAGAHASGLLRHGTQRPPGWGTDPWYGGGQEGRGVRDTVPGWRS